MMRKIFFDTMSFSQRFPCLPESFCEHYSTILGEEETEKFLTSCSTPLRKCLRVNTLKMETITFFEDKKEEWNLENIPWCSDGFFFNRKETDRSPMGHQLLHRLGGIYLQEASSMLPVEALFLGHETENFSGKIVMDVSAAPGSKTTQIAAKMQGKGCIVANELSASRTKALFSNLERCGVENSILTNMDGEKLCALLPEKADFILLDAPCTGEGTVRKNFDALNNWSSQNAKKLSGLQKKLLLAAFSALKIGGELVYSTCTLAQEENEEVVKFLQASFPNAVEIVSLKNLFPSAEKVTTKEGFLRIWPHIFDSEGFFVAKIKKIQPMSTEKFSLHLKKRPFSPALSKKTLLLKEYFLEQWGFPLPSHVSLWEKNNALWAFPENAENIFADIPCDRVGMPIVEMHKGNFWLTHECAISWGKNFSKNVKNIDTKTAEEIFEGKNVEISDEKTGQEILLRWGNFPITIGKMVNGMWKNGIPRANVKR